LASLMLSFFTQTILILWITHNSFALFSLKTLYPGGIRTRVFCSWSGCDVYCAMLPEFFKERWGVNFEPTAYPGRQLSQSQHSLGANFFTGANFFVGSKTRLKKLASGHWPLSWTKIGSPRMQLCTYIP
jgi:hypothetical protein